MFNKKKEIETMEDVIACMNEIKEKYPINEEVQNTTFNDIAKLDKDVTVLAYMDTVNKIEEAIEKMDNGKIDLYLVLLKNQADTITEIVQYRLNNKYKWLENIRKINKQMEREDKNDELIAKMDSCLGHGGDNQWQIK